MKKIVTIVGNRPQLIKLDKELKQVLVYTGQHYSESLKDVFFKGLKLPKPDYDLGETQLGKMIDKITKVLLKEKPAYVMVYGDTRSTLAGATAAYYLNIPIIHVEAGCRSLNTRMIEERIRILVDNIALIHLTPSFKCKEYLERDPKNTSVYNIGACQIDTMYETFPTKKPKDAYKYIVATIHREDNLNKRSLSNIFSALSVSKFPIRLYAHPRLQEAIKKFGIKKPKNIKILKPIPYKKMINEVAFAERVVTDSGGLQVEAFYLRRPCITLRYDTEWPETVEFGWNFLVGDDEVRIKEVINKIMPRGGGDQYVYGGGDAKSRLRILLNSL